MSTALNHQRPLPTRRAAWKLDPSSASFELKVKHRLGPIHVVRSFRSVNGLFQVDTAGGIRITFTIDTVSLELPDEQSDPRSRSHRFPDIGASSVARFESTHVIDRGAGRLHVTGQLAVGARCVPLELAVSVTKTESSLDVRATTLADHRRLGLTWIPAGPLKAPTELVVRARLVPLTDDDARGSIVMARRRRSIAVNNRYSFMARRSDRLAEHERL